MRIVPIILVAFLAFCFTSCTTSKTEVSYPSVEKYRPQFHFTPGVGWMNDPNGMVYYEGEYHLFYQHYPDTTVWGPMHWGHAVSKDLVHWEHLPIALYPDKLGYIFSGSAVIDWNNTTGFSKDGKPAMIAIFTLHDMNGERSGKTDFQSQGIAYSADKGRTWTMYDKNPVIPNPGIRDFRDPKVSWFPDFNKWIMTLAVQDHIEFYGSSDLKNWGKLSEFGKVEGSHNGVWECPDLFAISDTEGNKKWVLLVSIGSGGPQGGSATQYFVGDFNGKEFASQDSIIRWVDYGADNYASVTWSDIPKEDGRRLFMGWMSNWQYAQLVPATTWRSAMTLPREVILIKRNNVFEIDSKPVEELNTIHLESKTFNQAVDFTAQKGIKISVEDSIIREFKLVVKNETDSLIISSDGKTFFVDRSNCGITSFHDAFPKMHTMNVANIKIQKIDFYLDQSSVEIFINNGERVLTDLIFPGDNLNHIELQKLNPAFIITFLK